MRRFALFCLLALCGTAAADITMLLGPDGKPLANGKYRLLVIPSDAMKPPINSVLDVGGTDGPVPPIVPPIVVDTLDAKLTLLLAAVEDGEKAATGAKLKVAYEMTLQLTANSITDANSLRGVMAGIEKGVLDSLKKTAGWQPWTTGLAALVTPLDFSQCLTTYRAAAAKLGGGPVPPPVPPPPVVTTAVKAAVLIESGDQTAEQATLISQWRNDKAWSKLLLVLDPDQQTDSNQPDPQTSALKAAIGSRPLPRLVLLNSDGAFVADEALPANWDATKAALTAKGVRP